MCDIRRPWFQTKLPGLAPICSTFPCPFYTVLPTQALRWAICPIFSRSVSQIKKIQCTISDKISKYWNCSQADSKPVWHIPLLCVHCKTPDDGQWNCPKHVEFYAKNKFEKLVHLVWFIIRIYHDARSPERQIQFSELYLRQLTLQEETVQRLQATVISYTFHCALYFRTALQYWCSSGQGL